MPHCGSIDLAHVAPFRLGPIEVVPFQCEIANGETHVHLEPKVMQVLVALSREPGEVLSRDDLIDCVWEGRIVGDASVNRVMSLLRAAIREIVGDQVQIETLPRVGYRLLSADGSSLANIPPNEEPTSEDQTPTVTHGNSVWHKVRWVAVLAFAALVVVSALWLRNSTTSDNPVRIVMLPMVAAEGTDPFYASGLGGELRGVLGRQPAVEVLSGESTKNFVARGLSSQAIGQRLQADYVWEMQVSSGVQNIVLSGRLISTESGLSIWTDRVAAAPVDAQLLPERTMRAVMGALGRPISSHEPNVRISSGDYSLYLTAHAILRDRDHARYDDASSIFRALTEAEPEFADGWAGLAVATSFDAGRVLSTEGRAKMTAAREYIAKARELAPNLPQVLAISGLLEEDPIAAEEYLLRSSQIDPGDAQTWLWLGNAQNLLGKHSSALESYARVASLDPLWQRSFMASEFAAAMGDINRADAIDRAIAAASVEEWQVLFAQARIARRHGDWSGYLDMISQSAELAPLNEGTRLLVFARSAHTYLGLPVPPFPDSHLSLAFEYELANGRTPTIEAFNAVPAVEIWENHHVTRNAPAMLLNDDRGDDLLLLYDLAFGSPEIATAPHGIMDGPNFAPAVPYVVLAMRTAGRTEEAGLLLSLELADKITANTNAMTVTEQMLYARLQAVSGEAENALGLVIQARANGWPHTVPFYIGVAFTPLERDPAFASLRSNSRFIAIAREVAAERARERAEVLQMQSN